MILFAPPTHFLEMGQVGQFLCQTVVSGFLVQYFELLDVPGSDYSNRRICIIILHY